MTAIATNNSTTVNPFGGIKWSLILASKTVPQPRQNQGTKWMGQKRKMTPINRKFEESRKLSLIGEKNISRCCATAK
jgi:hypothetical protein